MMKNNKEEIQKRIKNLSKGKTSVWIRDAEQRLNNSGLKYSQRIALQILRVLRSKGMTQVQLATKLNVTPQQVSKWLKGKENFTIDTIAKIDAVLGIELLAIPNQVKKQVDNEHILIKSTHFKPQEVTYMRPGQVSEKTLTAGQMNTWNSNRKYPY